MEVTAERLSSTIKDYWAIEHLHRYAITFPYVKDKVVIDIASGDGYGTHLISKYAKKAVGIDISETAARFAISEYKKSNLSYVLGSTSKIPLEDNFADVVVSFETIEHHDEHHEMLSEVKRVLKPGGILIISSPDKLNYSDKTGYQNPYHIKELYKEEFHVLLKQYFKHSLFFKQNTIYGSLIFSERVELVSKEYNGDFDKVEETEIMPNPMYHLSICSDTDISNNDISGSFFSAETLIGSGVNSMRYEIEQLKKKNSDIYNSSSYKFGNFFIRLLYPLKKLIGKS